MNNLDKIYNLSVDLKQSEHRYNSYAKFINDDVNTSILKIKLLNDNDYVNLEGCMVEAFFLLANNTKFNDTCEIVNAENGEIQINLPSECLVVGENYIYITVVKDGKESNAPIISYRVIKGITDNLPPVDGDPIQQTVKQLLLDVKVVQANQNDLQKRYEQAFPQIAKAIQDAEKAAKRVEEVIAAGTQDLEVKDARDGEATLKDRLERDLKLGKEIHEDAEGSFITVDNSVEASIQNIEILGNTVQNPNNLSDIKSVGSQIADGHYKMSILSCGKNLLSSKWELGSISSGNNISSSNQIRTIDYIKVKSNVDYVLSGVPNYTIVFYDKNKKYISEIGRQGGTKFTIVENCMYIRFRTYTSDNITDVNLKIQLEEGTVATPYEPHKETKNTILLPCQLEKVGDVADRLYYDEVEKAWCIEKNVKSKTLNTLPQGIAISSLTNTVRFNIVKEVVFEDILNINPGNNRGLCNQLTINHMWDKDEEGFYVDSNICFRLNKSKFTTLDNDGYNGYLNKNPLAFKYATATPQKIILPLDVQIQLGSFANRTHIYSLDTEIEPTIKAKVSKSLGASVQSLNTKTDILKDRIEAIEGLKESQDMQYSTDTGHLVCEETQSGVIKDLKIKGKTLVNLLPNCTLQAIGNGTSAVVQRRKINRTLENGKQYTIIFEVSSDTNASDVIIAFYDVRGNSVSPIYFSNFNTLKGTRFSKCMTLNSPNIASELGLYVRGASEAGSKASISNILILEGDHTQNPPSYFEGLQSVGEDVDKIEVLTRKEDGNLFDGDINSYVQTNIVANVGSKLDLSSVNLARVTFKSNVKINPSKTYFLLPSDLYDYGVICTDDNDIVVYNSSWTNAIEFKLPQTARKLFIYAKRKDGQNIDKQSFVCENHVFSTIKYDSYIPYKAHKKEILYKDTDDTYKPVPVLREWDEIDDTKGKWYKRSEKVVLNGSENLIFNKTMQDKLQFLLIVPNIKTGEVLCDKFIYSHNAESKECIWVYNNEKIVIHINSSKLETQDVEGFKKWLQANPITVVYQLAQEEVYDIAPINLDAYSNKTMVCCSSGAISPHMSFSITSYITNLIQSNKERINNLEKEIFAEQELQNQMILENDLRLMDVEIAIMDFMPIEAKEKINLWRSNDMLREQTEFEFLKGRITSGSYTDDYLEKVINKYFKAGRLSQDEYDQLYDMIYPPVYNFMQ